MKHHLDSFLHSCLDLGTAKEVHGDQEVQEVGKTGWVRVCDEDQDNHEDDST